MRATKQNEWLILKRMSQTVERELSAANLTSGPQDIRKMEQPSSQLIYGTVQSLVSFLVKDLDLT